MNPADLLRRLVDVLRRSGVEDVEVLEREIEKRIEKGCARCGDWSLDRYQIERAANWPDARLLCPSCRKVRRDERQQAAARARAAILQRMMYDSLAPVSHPLPRSYRDLAARALEYSAISAEDAQLLTDPSAWYIGDLGPTRFELDHLTDEQLAADIAEPRD